MHRLSLILAAGQGLSRTFSRAERLRLQGALPLVLPGHRASACLRQRLGGSGVSVSTTAAGHTRLGGLMVCAAHHVCPVCHAQKMAHDRTRVQELVAEHYERGGFTVDCVLTVPHVRFDSLEETLRVLESTWAALRSKPVWRGLADDLGIAGVVRRLEVTISANGWHPHFHVSLLCEWGRAREVKGRSRHAVLCDVHALVAAAWVNAGLKVGCQASMHAQAAVAFVSAADGIRAVEYNTKNLGYTAKSGSLTVMDLLRIVDQSDDTDAVREAKLLFREYASAIKGKHMLTFAGAARVKTLAREASDAGAGKTPDDRLGVIAPAGWSAVLEAGLREALAQVKTRGELQLVVLLAALSAGHSSTPNGWLLLVEAKSVMVIKGGCLPSPLKEEVPV